MVGTRHFRFSRPRFSCVSAAIVSLLFFSPRFSLRRCPPYRRARLSRLINFALDYGASERTQRTCISSRRQRVEVSVYLQTTFFSLRDSSYGNSNLFFFVHRRPVLLFSPSFPLSVALLERQTHSPHVPEQAKRILLSTSRPRSTSRLLLRRHFSLLVFNSPKYLPPAPILSFRRADSFHDNSLEHANSHKCYP